MTSSIGMSELGSATRPNVAMIAVRASRSGMPAATSAPKTTSRMISVTGIESSPAFLRSSMKAASTSLSALTPNEPMNSSGCAACTSSTAATTGSIFVVASSGSPTISKSTSAARPALADLAGVLGVERRLDVRDHVERGDPGDDVFDCGREGRVLDGQRVALDEDALAGRLHELLVQELVDPAGFAHPGRGSARSWSCRRRCRPRMRRLRTRASRRWRSSGAVRSSGPSVRPGWSAFSARRAGERPAGRPMARARSG